MKEAKRLYQIKWRENNPDKVNAAKQRARDGIKLPNGYLATAVTKKCTCCGIDKPLSQFKSYQQASNKRKDGSIRLRYANTCIDCPTKSASEWKTNRGKRQAQLKAWKDRNPGHRKLWYEKNRDNAIEISKKSREKKKLIVLNHYSNGDINCNCCQNRDVDVLQLDHKNGVGNQHRRELTAQFSHKLSSDALYRWIIKNNFPPIYQVLCANCNMAKHILGDCIHQKGVIGPPVSRHKIYDLRQKTKVFDHYCNGDIKCNGCKEHEFIFLQIDHVDNNGGEQRKKIGVHTITLCNWLIKNGYPPGYQVLCANCNTKKMKLAPNNAMNTKYRNITEIEYINK